MSAVPAAAYLVEFDSGREVAGSPAFVPLGRGDGGFGGRQGGAVPDRLEAARASGFANGEAAAKATLEIKLAEQRETYARQLADERQAWVRMEADKLAQCLATMLGELESRIAEATARVLEPFLQAELRRQVIADLHAELEALLTKDPGIGVSVAGPEDLLQALRERLAERLPGMAVTYMANGEPDVRIAAGHSLLETRLGAWAAKIEEAVR